MSKVPIPKRIAEAFEYHDKSWKNVSEEERKVLYMLLVSDKSSCLDAKLLKKFAVNSPSKYLQILLNGYEVAIDLKQEVKDAFNRFIDNGNDKKLIEENMEIFTDKLSDFITQKF